MAKFVVVSTRPAEAKADALAVGVAEGLDLSKQPLVRTLDGALGGAVAELLRLGDLRGKFKETRVLATRGAIAAPRLVLVGLGKPADFTLDSLREASARAALVARDHRLRTLAMPLLAPPGSGFPARDAAQAAAEAVGLGLFEFREYKSPPSSDEDEAPVPLEEVRLIETRASRHDALRDGLRTGLVLAESTNLARGLIMRPSLDKPPEALARAAVQAARQARVRATVLGPADLKRLGMGALRGVGSGSAHPPRMVVLEHRGAAKPTVLLCGKGITFDSGGINLKPSEGMDRMKYDMAGSATVLATTVAAARLRVKARVVALMAVAENMPSGSALRPGDVVTAYNGKRIEVANTDAEGRLVLADALSYGVDRFKPDYVVDVATLTGAVRVALGNITTGIMGSDETLVQRLIAAGQRTGDDLWQLPLHAGYERQVKSEVADVRNLGAPGSAGAIAGAAFLKQFVGKHKWAHLDIAGTCWTEKGPGDLQKDYLPKGATGIGVRLLTEWLRGLK